MDPKACRRRIDSLHDESDPQRRRLIALYADRLDWAYLAARTATIEEEGRAMRLLREEFDPRC